MNSVGTGSRRTLWLSDDAADRDTFVARYNRVAIVEAVLSIRERQQRVVRRIIVASLVLTGIAVIVVGVTGWL